LKGKGIIERRSSCRTWPYWKRARSKGIVFLGYLGESDVKGWRQSITELLATDKHDLIDQSQLAVSIRILRSSHQPPKTHTDQPFLYLYSYLQTSNPQLTQNTGNLHDGNVHLSPSYQELLERDPTCGSKGDRVFYSPDVCALYGYR
jgi:hypothetical protein